MITENDGDGDIMMSWWLTHDHSDVSQLFCDGTPRWQTQNLQREKHHYGGPHHILTTTWFWLNPKLQQKTRSSISQDFGHAEAYNVVLNNMQKSTRNGDWNGSSDLFWLNVCGVADESIPT
jgi:hypothetical protein